MYLSNNIAFSCNLDALGGLMPALRNLVTAFDLQDQSIARGEIAHPQPPPSAGPATIHVDDLKYAKMVYAARRARNTYLPEDLLGEPGYDLLLDGYIAWGESRNVSVSSACIAASVAPTTALRWVKTLEERGLYTRRADPEDKRRFYIRLSEEGIALVSNSLQAQQKACMRIREAEDQPDLADRGEAPLSP